MTITLYKKDSASGTVYDSSVIESLSVTQNADIMADIVPIDTAICRIRSETPLVAEYMDVDDNTGITGRPLSPLVAPIGHYVVKQINNLGNNLYEIQGYSLVYRLDTPKVPAKYYNGVSLSVALKDVEKNANGSFGVTYNVDTALSGKTITGYCPEQTARERLQQFCWAVGGYVSCACSALINILAIPSTVQGTVPKSKIYAFPAVANEDEVARVNLTVHTYTAGTSGDDIVIDADGNKYVHTTSTLTMANTALTGVSNREISVDNATLVNSSNAQATLLRMASVYFNSGTWYGTTTPQGYIPGQMVQAEDRDGQMRQGYISALTYSFGKGAATTMELKQSVSIQGLPAPVLSVTSANETLWITSSDDRVTSFMLYDNDTLIHTFTQLSTPTASITNGTMSWNSITNADGYIVNAVKDGATQSKSVTETSINLSAWLTEAGTYSLTVKASGYGYIMSEESAAVAYTIQNNLATPTIAMNADGKTLEITDVENATSYDVYVDGTMKTNVASAPNTTTVDLSTLSDISDGAHTVKVKAKANGYIDSEFSNEVSYTKAASQGYYITFANIAYDETISEHVFIQINGEGNWIDLDNLGSLEEYHNVKFFKIYYVPNGTVSMALLNNDGSYPDMEDPSLSPFNITSATSVDTAMTIPVTEGNTDFIVTVFATSAFKQINLFKLDSVHYSSIAQANINKVYTIKDTTMSRSEIGVNYIGVLRKNTSGGAPIWTTDTVSGTISLELTISDSTNETTIVFRANKALPPYSGYQHDNYIALEGDTAATVADFANFTADSNANLVMGLYPHTNKERLQVCTRYYL